MDVFKRMVSVKEKLEKAMASNYSAPRVRWMKAIRRVLILHQVERIRMRLGLPPSKIYLALHDPIDHDEVQAHDHLPTISFSQPKQQFHRHPHHKVSYLSSGKDLFPIVDPSSKKKVFLNSHEAYTDATPTLFAMEMSYTTPPKHQPRRSFDQSHSIGSSSTPHFLASPTSPGLHHQASLPVLSHTGGRHHPGRRSPFEGIGEEQEHIPSLVESYHSIAEHSHESTSSLPPSFITPPTVFSCPSHTIHH